MIIVTHTGAKSGKSYTTPLVYTKDGDRYVIIASKAGAPKNPSWYHNLVAHPEVTLEIGNEKFKAKAAEVEGAGARSVVRRAGQDDAAVQRVCEKDQPQDSGRRARAREVGARFDCRASSIQRRKRGTKF